jgi:hypothetical protein
MTIALDKDEPVEDPPDFAAPFMPDMEELLLFVLFMPDMEELLLFVLFMPDMEELLLFVLFMPDMEEPELVAVRDDAA